ncbi:MAG: dTDP-4-dehydrorhamnose reductase [Nitrospinae bacterium]|nr:dTDP-4-dehydrorhamnose reductase [Nitrospinota bacterium]
MKILVTGGNGMLAQDILAFQNSSEFSQYTFCAAGKKELDITNEEALRKTIEEIRPEIIINSAAYTKVDDCESNQSLAFAINGDALENLGKICKEKNIKLVHISTDYVFNGNGTSPYKEENPVEPASVYGASKLKGEENIKQSGCDFLIIRTAWLFGKNGSNFVKTMLNLAEKFPELKVVNDQQGTPTFTRDLAYGILKLIDGKHSGLYHLTNSGNCTWYDFAQEIFRQFNKEVKVIPVTSEEFIRPAKRPVFSVLDTTKFTKATNHTMPQWQEALINYKNIL